MFESNTVSLQQREEAALNPQNPSKTPKMCCQNNNNAII